MAGDFDPYHKWLGIPPGEQPANHYRLLAIGLFEDDADVIHNAADRQMAHVRTFQGGPHAAQSQKLLNELAAARLCLVDATRKAAYDAEIRTRQARPAAVLAAAPVTAAAPAVQPMAAARHALPVATPLGATTVASAGAAAPAWGGVEIQVDTAPSTLPRAKAGRGKLPPHMAAVAVVVLAGLLAVGYAMWNAGGTAESERPGSPPLARTGPERPAPRPSAPIGGPFESTDESPPSRPPVRPGSQRPPPSLSSPEPPASGQGLNLLELIDLPGNVVSGNFRMERGALVASSPDVGRLRISLANLPVQYALTIVAERLQGDEFLGIVLPCGGRQVLAVLDSKQTSGLQFIDGKDMAGNKTEYTTPLFKPGRTSALTIFVRPSRIMVFRESETIIDWRGNPQRYSLPGDWALPDSQALAVGVRKGAFRISKMELRPIPGPVEPPPPMVASSNAEPPDRPPPDRSSPRTVVDTTPTDRRLPVPTRDELQEAQSWLKKQFDDELQKAKKPAAMASLARKLRDEAQQSADNAPRRYALLEQSASLAAESGQFNLARQALDDLGQAFQVKTLPLKEEALNTAAKFAKMSGDFKGLAESWLVLFNEAVRNDDYPAATRLADRALSVARKSRDDVFVKRIIEGSKDLSLLQTAWEKLDEAREALQSDPGNAAASAAWGRFVCAFKGDWTAGRPTWARGTDAASALARRDLNEPRSPAEQARLADDWWSAAELEAEAWPRKVLRERAAFWYRRAQGGLAGEALAQAQRRLEEVDKAASPFRAGQWVELLAMVDPLRHRIAGDWGRRGDEIGLAKPAGVARICVPVSPSASYELDLRFTLHEGHEVHVHLPVGQGACGLVLGGWDGSVIGLSLVDGNRADANSTTIRPANLPLRKRLKLSVRVEVAGDRAQIATEINGKKLIRWQGPIRALSNDGPWDFPKTQALGLGAFESAAVFHSMRLRIESGAARVIDD